MHMDNLKIGTKVKIIKEYAHDGQPATYERSTGYITAVHTGKLEGMCDVRLWDGQRHVGDVVMHRRDLQVSDHSSFLVKATSAAAEFDSLEAAETYAATVTGRASIHKITNTANVAGGRVLTLLRTLNWTPRENVN